MPREAEAIVALAAYDAYRKALADGDSPDEPLQRWQREVWSAYPRPSIGQRLCTKRRRKPVVPPARAAQAQGASGHPAASRISLS